jgi:hypothetical protein
VGNSVHACVSKFDHAVCCGLQVDQLRAEVARYQARLAELENDFLSLDVVANTEVSHSSLQNRQFERLVKPAHVRATTVVGQNVLTFHAITTQET